MTDNSQTETINWENGVYKGEVSNNKPHGRGSITYAIATPVFANNTFYTNEKFSCTGNWIDGKKHGYWEININYNETYKGYIKDDLFHGKGIYYFSTDLSSYIEGNWYEGEIGNRVIYKFTNGNCYAGEWEKNNKHGHGIMYYVNGDKSIGQWVNDKQHGEIILISADNKYKIFKSRKNLFE